uniref:Uncharacterized protein n=1 Tax=Anguilla anguilla TaxID=7936 RepID=A0A0E9QSJ4_ANGAN
MWPSGCPVAYQSSCSLGQEPDPIAARAGCAQW